MLHSTIHDTTVTLVQCSPRITSAHGTNQFTVQSMVHSIPDSTAIPSSFRFGSTAYSGPLRSTWIHSSSVQSRVQSPMHSSPWSTYSMIHIYTVHSSPGSSSTYGLLQKTVDIPLQSMVHSCDAVHFSHIPRCVVHSSLQSIPNFQSTAHSNYGHGTA